MNKIRGEYGHLHNNKDIDIFFSDCVEKLDRN